MRETNRLSGEMMAEIARIVQRYEEQLTPAAVRHNNTLPDDPRFMPAVKTENLNFDLASKPGPFRAAAAIAFMFPHQKRKSTFNQLRFFAALAGPAQPFTLHRDLNAQGQGTVQTYAVPAEPIADMKSFVRDILQSQAPQLCTIAFHEGRTKFQLHGEQNVNLGKFIFHQTIEFMQALAITQHCDLEENSNRLHGLLDATSEWCFDGVINQMNRFRQDNILFEVNLRFVPNLIGKENFSATGSRVCPRVWPAAGAGFY